MVKSKYEVKMVVSLVVGLFVILIGIFQILGGLIGSGVVMFISAFFILYMRNMIMKEKNGK